jgi:hypothetical protein
MEVAEGTPTLLDLMLTPYPAFHTPIIEAATIATLLLSRGKYFIASRIEKSLLPEPGHSPISLNDAGLVRDRTPDHRFFLVDVFGATEEFTTNEEVTVGHRLIRLEDLMKATFFADFATMQASADDNYSLIESLNLE